jgi:nicotinamidase/pyrazinamidase
MEKIPGLLLIVDVQNDFCSAGALSVPFGEQVVPVINKLTDKISHSILTQDWHPEGHLSFASSHPGLRPFDTAELAYGAQTLWPDHCVQGTPGAEFHKDLHTAKCELILRKGFRRTTDSYSAFFENDRSTSTGLAGYLRERYIKSFYICGLATDYCVLYSALDARRLGFRVFLVDDACKGINQNGSIARAYLDMATAGVILTTSEAILSGHIK